MRDFLIISLLLFLLQGCFLRENPIKSSMKGDEFLKEILKKKDQYELQILYTEIERDINGDIEFLDYELQVDEEKYFYPASSIKLPIVILTLDKINELRSRGLDLTLKSKIKISTLDKEKTSIITDSITSFQNLISDVFLVSDNTSSNVLIDFIGYNHFNTKMNQVGFNNTYLNHKFNPDPYVNYNWQIKTLKNELISAIEERIPISARDNLDGLQKGDNVFRGGKVVAGSLDFTLKNRASINDMHNIIKKLIFPEKTYTRSDFNLNVEDYDFLRYWMSRFTFEDVGEKFRDDKKFFNSYNKFFIHGMDTIINNSNIRVYNKIGQAYGTSTDSAYITSYQDGVEFILTATIYTNKNKIINDNIYEYDEVAIPFLAKLSQSIYSRLLE